MTVEQREALLEMLKDLSLTGETFEVCHAALKLQAALENSK